MAPTDLIQPCIITALLIALFVVVIVPHTCASHVDRATSAPTLRIEALFKACKGEALIIPEGEVELALSLFYPSPLTRESVERIRSLLLQSSAEEFHPRTEKAPAAPSPNLLVAELRRRIGTGDPRLGNFLVKYVVFTAIMCGNLRQDEVKVLKSIFSQIHLGAYQKVSVEELINGLADSMCSVDSFAVVAVSLDSLWDVERALFELDDDHPGIVVALAEGYLNRRNRSTKHIPYDVFLLLDFRFNLGLSVKGAIPERVMWEPSDASEPSIAVLSESIIALPYENAGPEGTAMESEHRIYGQETHLPDNRHIMQSKVDYSIPEILLRETRLWIEILLYYEDLEFQMCTIPLVCKFWKDMHPAILSRSLIVRQVLLKGWRNRSFGKSRAFKLEDGLRIYSINMARILFCVPVCPDDLQIEKGNKSWQIRIRWTETMQKVMQKKPRVSLESYVQWYVSCCKANEGPLELYLLPGMSDEEYIEVIETLLEKYEIIPLIQTDSKEDHGRFVRMLERHIGLAHKLLTRDSCNLNELVISLFLAQIKVPPTVHRLFLKVSELYCWLVGTGGSIQCCMEVMTCDLLEVFKHGRLIARFTINFCLMMGSKYDPAALKALGEEVWTHPQIPYCGVGVPKQGTKRQISRALNSVTMKYLFEHCEDYSEEQFRTVRNALECCGVFDHENESDVCTAYISRHCDGTKFPIKLT